MENNNNSLNTLLLIVIIILLIAIIMNMNDLTITDLQNRFDIWYYETQEKWTESFKISNLGGG